MRSRFTEIEPGLWMGACPSDASRVHATRAMSKAVTTAAMLNRWRGHLPAS